MSRSERVSAFVPQKDGEERSQHNASLLAQPAAQVLMEAWVGHLPAVKGGIEWEQSTKETAERIIISLIIGQSEVGPF
jgi:hypothetical protein